jgi:hypothetical protein
MTEETIVDNQEQEHIEPTPVEQEAMAQGWVPKDQFSGDEHKWVEAGEFLRRGELFKKIEQVSKEAKEAKKVLGEFKAHYAKVKETEYQNALKALKAERRNALVEGDFERVETIEERMETVKTEAASVQEEIQSTTQVPEVHPEVAAWVEANPWYNKDTTMRAFADAIALELNKEGLTGPALLRGVDAKVRETFPAKFKNPNRERPGAVEGAATKGSSRTKDDFQLSEQETRIMNTFVRDGVMTKEQYIADLKKVKGVN